MVIVNPGVVAGILLCRAAGTGSWVCTWLYQYHFFEVNPSESMFPGSGTKITPVEDSHTRIKPLDVASDHGRYRTITPERALVSVGEWPLHINITVANLQPFHFRNGYVTAVSLLKPLYGGFRIETATWTQKWVKKSVGASRKL